MKIHNVRLNHACNSSSSHSVIIVPNDVQAADSYEDLEFGWDDFQLFSKGAKSDYLAAMIYSNLRYVVPEEVIRAIIKELLPLAANNTVDSVDHQSVLRFPKYYDMNFIHMEFLKALRDAILQDSIGIIGGNDNDITENAWKDYPSPDYINNIPKDTGDDLIAKYDDRYDFFTLFNRNTGAKIRLSFDNKEIHRASTPELVDLKITDNCPFGCSFCYQNSTANGNIANVYDIANILYRLSELEVFEVAFGGGEPTLHPDFDEIIDTANRYRIVSNFTTKNIKFFRGLDKAFYDKIGSIAVSISKIKELEELLKYFAMSGVDNITIQQKISIQVVGGLKSYHLPTILKKCSEHYLRVTILGYKETGRGNDKSSFDKFYYEHIIDDIKHLQDKGYYLRIAVDTQFVKDFENRLTDDLFVDKVLFHSDEGAFSCYIDAVTKRIAPSSYCDEKFYQPLNIYKLTEQFQSLVVQE